MARQPLTAAQRTAIAILLGAAALGAVHAAAPAPTLKPVATAAPSVAATTVALPPPPVTAAKPPAPTATPARPPMTVSAPLAIHHVIDTHGAIRYGDWFWQDAGAAGPLTIAVDLKASVLSVFRGGDEIGTTAIIYGADDRQTPLGTFPILQKDRHHFSSRYHHAPMPYMLRLTGDGVSIHASEIAADYATHGCIGVPRGFAERLFAVVKVGDRVIVTNRGMRAA